MPPNDAVETLMLAEPMPDVDEVRNQIDALRAAMLSGDNDDILFDNDEMPLPDEYVEPIEPVIFPADLRFCVTVFYDPEVFRDNAAVNELQARMERTYGGREIEMRMLDKPSIENARLSPFPESEARFLKDGYVANVEGRIFDQGGQSQSSYARRNIATLAINAMLLATLLHKQPIAGINRALTGKARWREVWKTMAPVMGRETLHLDERDGRLMDRMVANPDAPIDLEANGYPLIEHEDLFLGSRNFRTARLIHWTYDASPMGAWDTAENGLVFGALFDSAAKEVRKQIRFEANNARYLFRPELLCAGAARLEVTPAMIATWYSQAIAAIRKINWLLIMEEDSSLAAHALHEEIAVHGFALGAAERVADNANSWDELVAVKSTELRQFMVRNMPPVAIGQTMTHKISWSEELLGGLVGTTYDSQDEPGESPYSNPNIFSASLARWIGALKRKQKAGLDFWTAESILSFWRRSREPLLLSQFPEATWLQLVEISEAMEFNRDLPELNVTYAWTQDRNEPYKCAFRDNSLALEGPLLCFPTLQASYWQEKARIIAGLRGFEAR